VLSLWTEYITSKQNLERIFIPICFQHHASLVVVFWKERKIVHYDTLRRSDRDKIVLSTLYKLLSRYCSIHCTGDDSNWTVVAAGLSIWAIQNSHLIENICAQRNSWDCVLYCLKFAELIATSHNPQSKMLSLKHSSIPHFRLFIADSLMKHCQLLQPS
jgi:Ulp1 family protease